MMHWIWNGRGIAEVVVEEEDTVVKYFSLLAHVAWLMFGRVEWPVPEPACILYPVAKPSLPTASNDIAVNWQADLMEPEKRLSAERHSCGRQPNSAV